MQQFAERIAKLPLAFQPGTTWDYSHSTDILGRLVEVVSGKSLYQFEKENILDPLGMTDTSFYVTDTAKQARIAEPFKNDRAIGAGVEFNDPRVVRNVGVGRRRHGRHGRGLCALRHHADERRHARRQALSRAEDPRLHDVGSHGHARSCPGPYYLPGPGYGFGLGFGVRKDAGLVSTAGSAGEYNWGGAGGTYFWVDPKENMFVDLRDAIAAQSRALSRRAAQHDLRGDRQAGAHRDGLSARSPKECEAVFRRRIMLHARLLLHERPQRVVDAILPAGPGRLEVIEHVAIEAQRDHLLGVRNGGLGLWQLDRLRRRLLEGGFGGIARARPRAVFGRSSSCSRLLRCRVERRERRESSPGPCAASPSTCAMRASAASAIAAWPSAVGCTAPP